MAKAARFPNEVLLKIVSYLSTDKDSGTLSALSRTSKTTYDLSLPFLYKAVVSRKADGLEGIAHNFLDMSVPEDVVTVGQRKNTQPSYLQGAERGLHLLSLIREVTLCAIPRVVESTGSGDTHLSGWPGLKALCSFPRCTAAARWKSLTLEADAVDQLPLASSNTPGPRSTSTLPTCLPLEALLLFGRPRHIRILHPHTAETWPYPAFSTPPLPLSIMRPHEVLLASTLAVVKGHNTTLCVHDVLDQQIPIHHVGGHHHVSFIQFPNVPRQIRRGRRDFNPLPYVLPEERLKQISNMLHRSNPCFRLDPDGKRVNCEDEPSCATWEESKEATWTIYRIGAMIAELADHLDDEPAVGRMAETSLRNWMTTTYSVDKGHPEGFADGLQARIRFVHGDEGERLVCQACHYPV